MFIRLSFFSNETLNKNIETKIPTRISATNMPLYQFDAVCNSSALSYSA